MPFNYNQQLGQGYGYKSPGYGGNWYYGQGGGSQGRPTTTWGSKPQQNQQYQPYPQPGQGGGWGSSGRRPPRRPTGGGGGIGSSLGGPFGGGGRRTTAGYGQDTKYQKYTNMNYQKMQQLMEMQQMMGSVFGGDPGFQGAFGDAAYQFLDPRYEGAFEMGNVFSGMGKGSKHFWGE